MIIIDKIFNKILNDTWDYYEIININNILYKRYNIIDDDHKPFNNFDWCENCELPEYDFVVFREKQLELEKQYSRIQKLKNILDGNY